MVRLFPDCNQRPIIRNVCLSQLLVWVIIDELQLHEELTFMEMCILSQRYTNRCIPAYLAIDYLLKEGVVKSSPAPLPVYSLA